MEREVIERHYRAWIEIHECGDKVETIDALLKQYDESDAYYLVEKAQQKLCPTMYYRRKKRSLFIFRKDDFVSVLAKSSCDAESVVKRHFVAMLKELRELYQSRIDELLNQ